MDKTFVERFRTNLVEKRDNLTAWFSTTPPNKRQVILGAESDGRVHAHLSTLDAAITKSTSQSFGLCEECGEYVEEERLEMDYTCCVCLDHLSTEETRSLERELELAQSVQRSLLPQRLEDIPGLEVAAFSRPAQIVGGDYFDFFEYQNGANGVAIADVAGHGVSASLLMSSVQTLLRTLAPAHISPAAVMQQIHHLYRHNIRFTTFVTLFMGAYDPENCLFTYSNAGHNPPLVIRKAVDGKGEVAWLQPTGPAVGLVEEADYGEETVSLSPGDVVLMYTDGVTEAINSNNQEFGQERLAELAKQHSALPAKEALGKIRQGLREFTEETPLEDDTTIVIFRIDEK
jgi:sigma-B regulation protein RsbU (phosphoserine phosphatase)